MARRLTIMIALALTGAAAPPPGERVVMPGETVAITVNGVAGRLRIDPGAPGHVIVTPALAAQAGLKGGGMLGFGVMYNVGGQIVIGRTQTAKVAGAGDRATKQRVIWTPRAYAAGVDAVAGPGAIDAPVVRFVLHPVQPGEQAITLPMTGGTGLFGNWFGLMAQTMVGGEPMALRFAPDQPRTVANAGAARRLVATWGGGLSGAAFPQTIAFGIDRPLRDLVLARPWAIGPLGLTRLTARVAEAAALPEAGAAAAPVDPDEVVVTAKEKKHDPRRDRVTLGADLLSHCSSLVFDKPARQIRLSCR